MDVELLLIPQCPGADDAAKLLRAALDDLGLVEQPFSVVVIDDENAARERRFAGSPAFLVDGVDLFADGIHEGRMACRVYPTPDGLRNVPTSSDLAEALKARTDRPQSSSASSPVADAM